MNKVFIILGLVVSSQVFANDNATFSWINSNILQTKCTSCHRNFSNYDGIKSIIVSGNADQSAFYSRVADDSMPPENALSNDEKAAIKDWINSGAANN